MTLDSGLVKIEKKSDFDSLANLYESISQQVSKAQFNWNKQTAAAEFLVSETFAYLEKYEIVSFLTYRTYVDRIEIMACGTDPICQKKGTATKLLQNLKTIAAQQGLPISLEVHEFNASALGLYFKCGFQHLHTRKGYYSDGKDALIMGWPAESHNQS